jgi:hypothetical protein
MVPVRTTNGVEELFKTTVRPGSVVAEVGVRFGYNALNILDIIRPKKLYLIDDWSDPSFALMYYADIPRLVYGAEAKHTVAQKMREYVDSGVVEILDGNIDNSIDSLPDESLDLIYLAKNPEQDFVYNLLAKSYPKIKKRGWLCGNDYCAIANHGVKRAVSGFCNDRNLRVDVEAIEEELPVYHREGTDLPVTIAYNSFGIWKNARRP